MPTDTVIHDSDNAIASGGAFANKNDRYLRNYKLLDSQYDQWKAAYKEVADYIALGRGRFMDNGEIANQRSKAAAKVINNTATDALHMLGAGLHGGLSSPARPWFQLQFVDEDMNKFSAYRSWMDDCEKRIYAAFKRSNFYGMIHNVYEEIGGFGTGAMMCDDHEKYGLLFHYFTVGDYRFTVGADGRTHCFYRKFKMQAVQCAQYFGKDSCSEKIQRLLQTNPYEWVEVEHCVEPNESYNSDKMDSFPFTDVYFETKEKEKRLRERGFVEMPVVTPRWQVLSNEAYGWGPGLETIGLAKAIQRMERQSYKGSDKMVDPPLAMPSSMKDRMTDLGPGGRNFYDETGAKIQKMVDIDPTIMAAYRGDIDALETKIRRNFFNELFLAISQEAPGNMNIPELLARQEEKFMMVGPVVTRLLYEHLQPLVERVFAIEARAGRLPPPPAELKDVQYKVDFISILAQAQKLIAAQGMTSYLGIVERAFTVDPNSITKTNMDKFLEESADMLSVPNKIIRTDDEVGAIRKQIADAAAAEKEQMAMAQGVDNAQKLGNTPTGEGTALGDLEKEVAGNA